VSSVPLIQTLINDGTLTAELAFLATSSVNDVASVGAYYEKVGINFNGISFDLKVTSVGTSGGFVTGSTTGVTVTYSGTVYSGIEDKLGCVVTF
jgi:hypothetical protein